MSLSGIDNQHVDIALRQGGLDPGEDFGEKRIADIGNQDNDRAGALAPQIPRLQIDPVPGLLGRGENGVSR